MIELKQCEPCLRRLPVEVDPCYKKQRFWCEIFGWKAKGVDGCRKILMKGKGLKEEKQHKEEGETRVQ